MSALPPKADIHRRERHVRFVPKADIAGLAQLAAIGSRTAAIRIVGALLLLANSTRTQFDYGRLVAGVAHMRIVKNLLSIAVSLGLVAVVTAILWQVNLSTGGSHRLIYFYLFPVALIAALYNGRLAVSCAAVALVCADLFLQEPLYSLANDNPLEYGDLIWFAVLAAAGIKFIRVLVRPRAKILKARSSPADI